MPTYYGGQAVIEGVMMRGKKSYAIAVRKPDGEIALIEQLTGLKSQRYPFLKWPIIRGVVAFLDSLTLGFKTITQSAELAGFDLEDTDEEPSRFERFLTEKLGDKLNDWIMRISVVLAVLLAVGLFMMLPVWIGQLFTPLLGNRLGLLGVVEGLARIVIFILYVYLISLSKDIKRVYQYHGAEHKTINGYESGAPLTPETISKYSRLHKRCGTSFLLIVMLVSMFVFLFIRTDVIWLRFASRILLVPVIAGLSYELIKWAGSHDNWLVKAISFPGLCLQRLTTAEPDEKQIEVAIRALEAVLANDRKDENHA